MMKSIVAAAFAAAFLAAVSLPPASAQTTQPGATTTTPSKPAKRAGGKRALSPGQIAARERMKKCGAEWKAAKAAGKIEKGMRWPKFWSACNKRLKAQGT